MARGKHGQRAETRRKIETAEASIESYQHAIKRLTTENRDLRDRISEMERSYAHQVKRLKVERDEGLSPMVAVVQRENARLSDELSGAKQRAADVRRRCDRALEGVVNHFKVDHKLLPSDAVHAAFRACSTDQPAELMPENVYNPKGKRQ